MGKGMPKISPEKDFEVCSKVSHGCNGKDIAMLIVTQTVARHFYQKEGWRAVESLTAVGSWRCRLSSAPGDED
jgi:hypothetical protein